jgi:hypothetical protein
MVFGCLPARYTAAISRNWDGVHPLIFEMGHRAAMCVRKWPVSRLPTESRHSSKELRSKVALGIASIGSQHVCILGFRRDLWRLTPAQRIIFVFSSTHERTPQFVSMTRTTPSSPLSILVTVQLTINYNGDPFPSCASMRCSSHKPSSGPGTENLLKRNVDVGL